jgi:hypothetical protein
MLSAATVARQLPVQAGSVKLLLLLLPKAADIGLLN